MSKSDNWDDYVNTGTPRKTKRWIVIGAQPTSVGEPEAARR